MLTVVIVNAVVLLAPYQGSSASYLQALDYLNTVFVGIYGVEMMVRMGEGGFRGYFDDYWHWYVFCVGPMGLREGANGSYDWQGMNEAMYVAQQHVSWDVYPLTIIITFFYALI